LIGLSLGLPEPCLTNQAGNLHSDQDGDDDCGSLNEQIRPSNEFSLARTTFSGDRRN
jgi:hypothetical protein